MAGSSLIPFHRVLIATGIVFCAGFAFWTFAVASREGGSGLWLLGAVFLVLAAALAYYLKNLTRFLGLGGPGRPR